jgi:hypothetical protein
MRRVYLLMAPVAALGLVAALLIHAIAFGTPAGTAPPKARSLRVNRSLKGISDVL